MAIKLDEIGDTQKAFRINSKNEMPPTPDMSVKMAMPKRQSPFILDDFKGSWAYRQAKP